MGVSNRTYRGSEMTTIEQKGINLKRELEKRIKLHKRVNKDLRQLKMNVHGDTIKIFKACQSDMLSELKVLLGSYK